MKFSVEVEVNLPKEVVWDLMMDDRNLKHWQDGFISYEAVSGLRGEVGSKGLLKYKQGSGVMELHETILDMNPPDSFEGMFEHKSMDNTMKLEMKEMGPDKTKVIQHIDYIKTRGIMPTLMVKLFPSVMRKMTLKWLQQFKHFAENQEMYK